MLRKHKRQTEPATIIIGGQRYVIPHDLTVGEGREVKRITGMTLSEFGRAVRRTRGDQDVTAAVVWIVLHRADPDVTIKDVDAMRYEDLEQVG